MPTDPYTFYDPQTQMMYEVQKQDIRTGLYGHINVGWTIYNMRKRLNGN